MSRSHQIRPRFTDPRDIKYLQAFGATERLLTLEEVSVSYSTVQVLDFAEVNLGEFFGGDILPVPVTNTFCEFSLKEMLTPEQRQAVSLLAREFYAFGFRSETMAIPQSTGGVTVEMLIGKPREKVAVKGRSRDEKARLYHA